MNLSIHKRKYITWIVTLTALSVWAHETSPVERSWQDYQIISDHNIFIRHWSARSTGKETAEVQVNGTQETPVLTGISRRGQETIAFFENPQTQATTLIHAGQEFEDGKVVAIGPNEAVYEQRGQQIVIAIGNNLSGITKTLTQEKPAATQEKTVTTQASKNDSNTPESKDTNAMERMMRERRLRETGE